MQKPPIKKHLDKSDKIPLEAKTGARQIYFSNGNGFVDTPSFARNKLLAGNQIIGPAVIEEYASTTVLFPDDSLEVDGYGNLIITVGKVLI
jgi:N-methylhydantoinase A